MHGRRCDEGVGAAGVGGRTAGTGGGGGGGPGVGTGGGAEGAGGGAVGTGGIVGISAVGSSFRQWLQIVAIPPGSYSAPQFGHWAFAMLFALVSL